MNNLTQNLVRLEKGIKVLTDTILEIESACDDYSFFIPDGDDEYGQCVIDVNHIREILSDAERALISDNEGEWIWDGNKYKCSKCGHHHWRINTEEHDEAFEDLWRTNAYKFCPNCGIKMKGMHNECIMNDKEEIIKTLEEIKNEMEFGDIYTTEEFKKYVEDGSFIPYDGWGYYHNGVEETRICVWDTDEIDTSYPYVCWYNK